ncbi:phytanoyl-CoA dioxygenase family protein [Streptomyces sp. FR-108]|uniref:phytanoyl-CoA dioxygenase family protein n=1 Tax=Streptomyces sp. FR-108 TaxID=3416665 RepID=UPI003CF6856F
MRKYAFTQKTPDPAAVLSAVTEFGLAHLPGIVEGEELDQIQEQCGRLLTQPPGHVEHMDYDNGIGLHARRDRLAAEFGKLTNLFDKEWMLSVAESYFEGSPYVFNYDLICVLDVAGTRHPAHQPHYDRLPNLKFFVYLSDTTEYNGAFRCLPGSQGYGKHVQRENRLRHVLPQLAEPRALPPGLRRGIGPVEGPAGTVLVIDSDLIHQAGTVTAGDRMVVRSRSFPPQYLAGPPAAGAPTAGGDPDICQVQRSRPLI